MATDTLSGSKLSQRVGLAAIWGALALVYALVLVVYGEWPTGAALVVGGLSTATAALVSMPVWHFTGRMPWPERVGPGFVLLHVAVAMLFTIVWHGLDIALSYLVLEGRMRQLKHAAMGWETLVGIVFYGFIAGVMYLLRARERLAAERRLTAEADARAARTELALLRSQLNPHFLFNALHSVSGLVHQDPEAADLAIERLGALIRYALSHARQEFVPLEEDIGFARDFVEIERMRLGDRLRMVIDAEAGALDAMVPSLTIQPLVENAIRHGLDGRPGGGTVWITARLDGTVLCVTVADDGVGPQSSRPGTGLGLGALEQRMRLACPGATVSTDAPAVGGFVVHVTLPV